jgi:hypothetical protein
MKAFNGVNHGSANLTTNRTDVAQDNTQQFHEVTKGNGRLLGMLVAGVTLWLVRQLWPE